MDNPLSNAVANQPLPSMFLLRAAALASAASPPTVHAFEQLQMPNIRRRPWPTGTSWYGVLVTRTVRYHLADVLKRQVMGNIK